MTKSRMNERCSRLDIWQNKNESWASKIFDEWIIDMMMSIAFVQRDEMDILREGGIRKI